MISFYLLLKTEDFAHLSSAPADERTVYLGTPTRRKRKGGHPPFCFSVVESIIDFKMAIERGDFRAAEEYYRFLLGLLNPDWFKGSTVHGDES